MSNIYIQCACSAEREKKLGNQTFHVELAYAFSVVFCQYVLGFIQINQFYARPFNLAQ